MQQKNVKAGGLLHFVYRRPLKVQMQYASPGAMTKRVRLVQPEIIVLNAKHTFHDQMITVKFGIQLAVTISIQPPAIQNFE